MAKVGTRRKSTGKLWGQVEYEPPKLSSEGAPMKRRCAQQSSSCTHCGHNGRPKKCTCGKQPYVFEVGNLGGFPGLIVMCSCGWGGWTTSDTVEGAIHSWNTTSRAYRDEDRKGPGRLKLRNSAEIKKLRKAGLSIRKIAAKIGLSTASVQRGLQD